MQELLREMHTWMDGYMKSFHTDDAEVMQGIRIKEEHTGCVTAIAVQLAKHLGLDAHDVALAEIMGLFHDVGRFRQYTLYTTFNDAVSEDHADLGLKVLAELPFLDRLSDEDAELVRFAIARHNKKEIGAVPSKRALSFARLLRDADKLDIYRVLAPFLTPDGCAKAPKFMHADASQLISPHFIAIFRAGGQADYRELKTHGDRKLVRLLWVYDINFSWTLRAIVRRGYVDRIVRYLPEQNGVAEGLARLNAYIEKKCAERDTWDA